MISSGVMPPPNLRSICSTVIRVPLITGFPNIISGLTSILSCNFILPSSFHYFRCEVNFSFYVNPLLYFFYNFFKGAFIEYLSSLQSTPSRCPDHQKVCYTRSYQNKFSSFVIY